MEKRLLEIRKRQLELREIAKTATGDELDNAVKEAEDLDREKSDIEKRSALTKRLSEGEFEGSAIELPGKKQEERSYGLDSKEYRSAFFKTLAGVELNEVEKRAMTTNSNSAGAAVPTITMNKIYEKIENESIAYKKVTVSHLKGHVVIPIEKLTADVERKGEGEGGAVKDDKIDSLELGAKKYIKLVRLTCELENTAIDALEDYIVKKLSKKLMLAIEYDIINGNGTNCVTGILHTITPIETASNNTISYDDLCDLFAELPAIAKAGADLMMSTNTLYKKVKKVKDNEGRPIFDTKENKVLGREVIENDNIPDGYILFGDFSSYMFNWSKDAEISKSDQAAFACGDSVFRVLALADGGLAELGSMVALKVKTSSPST